MRALDVQIVSCDTVAVEIMREFHGDFRDLPAATAVGADSREVARLFATAHRYVQSPSSWGSFTPGVGVDCAGSVLSVLVETGLVRLPATVVRRVGGLGRRSHEVERHPLELVRKMMGFMGYALYRCARTGVAFIPIVDPEDVLPFDVFMTPYVMSVGGQHVMPHTMLCVADEMFLNTNPETGRVDLVSVSTVLADVAVVDFAATHGVRGVSFRPYFFNEDAKFRQHRDRLLTHCLTLLKREDQKQLTSFF